MTFLPIVDRALRVQARRKQTYSARVRTALAATVLGGGAMVAYNHFGFGWTGFSVFSALTNALFVLCLVVGAHTTFDCLSEEKREGTLGLLFLTDLKGHDIILGKLAATSIGVACGCLVALPVAVIFVPLGKAQPGELMRVILTLVNTLFLSLNLGLLVSAVSRKQQRAKMAASLLILFLWLVLPGLSEWLRRSQFSPSLYLPLLVLSPTGTYQWAIEPTAGMRTNLFWLSLTCTHLLGWVFLAAASLTLPRVWQDQAFGAAGARWRARFKQWCYGKSAVRAAFRNRLLEKNPILWFMGRDRLKPLWVWVLLAVFAAVGIGFSWFDPKVLENPALPAVLTVGATLVIKLWMGSESSRGFAEERWQGTLEWLFCTPLSVREILRGQWLAVKRQFFGPIIVLLGAQTAVLFFGLQSGSLSESDRGFWMIACAGYITMFLLDAWALCWTGMWSGMTAKNPRLASSGAAIRIVLLPGAVLYMVLITEAFLSAFGTSGNTPSIGLHLALWLGWGVINSLGWGFWTRRQLHRRMRSAATDRFTTERPFASWRPFGGSKGEFPPRPIWAR